MISVLVPIYNVEPYLEEAIESVMHQTYTNLEIILVDDGSIDGSGEICDRYQKKDSRIMVIHQENRGVSAARNAGLDICKGEMIAFLDSDDAFCEDMLQKMSDAMLESGADIVECKFAIYKGGHPMDPQKIRKKKKYFSSEGNRRGLYPKRDALLMQLDEKIAVTVWNKLYTHKVWDSIRFREGQNYEDLDIILPLLGEAESVYILDEELYMRRIRKGSITTTYTFKNIRDRELALSHYFEYIQSHFTDDFGEKNQSWALTVRYTLLLTQYYYICSYPWFPEKAKCIADLRKQILDAKSRIDIRGCGRGVQVASVICFVFAKEIILFAGGESYLGAVPAFRILLLSLIPIGASNILGGQVLVPTGKEKRLLTAEIVGAVFNFIANLILIPYLSIWGAALTTVISEVIVWGICLYYVRKDLDMDLGLGILRRLAGGFLWRGRIILLRAESRIKGDKLPYYCRADLKIYIEDTGLNDDSYDMIICNHVLEHVSDYKKALRELYRMVRPGGRVLLSFPVDPSLETVYEDDTIVSGEKRVRNLGHLIIGRDEKVLRYFSF